MSLPFSPLTTQLGKHVQISQPNSEGRGAHCLYVMSTYG